MCTRLTILNLVKRVMGDTCLPLRSWRNVNTFFCTCNVQTFLWSGLSFWWRATLGLLLWFLGLFFLVYWIPRFNFNHNQHTREATINHHNSSIPRFFFLSSSLRIAFPLLSPFPRLAWISTRNEIIPHEFSFDSHKSINSPTNIQVVGSWVGLIFQLCDGELRCERHINLSLIFERTGSMNVRTRCDFGFFVHRGLSFRLFEWLQKLDVAGI